MKNNLTKHRCGIIDRDCQFYDERPDFLSGNGDPDAPSAVNIHFIPSEIKIDQLFNHV